MFQNIASVNLPFCSPARICFYPGVMLKLQTKQSYHLGESFEEMTCFLGSPLPLLQQLPSAGLPRGARV